MQHGWKLMDADGGCQFRLHVAKELRRWSAGLCRADSQQGQQRMGAGLMVWLMSGATMVSQLMTVNDW